MASEAETTQPEKPVYKKIVEYKKKISLVEGKRRAMFNKYEQEKTSNKEKERVLDMDLKDTEQDLHLSQSTKEILLKRVSGRQFLDRKLLQRLSPNSALNTMDYKVADLQKTYNKIRFRAGKKAEYLSLLTAEISKGDMKADSLGIAEFSKDEQRQRYLENEIHKTGLKMMEADMVRKKYDIILDMLKQERMGYITQIENLEKNCNSQQKDVKKLEGEYKEACEFRDEARAVLKDKEIEMMNEGKERDKNLNDTKKAMKNRTDMFKSVDHLLMGSVASSKHDGSSTMSDSMIRDGEREGEEIDRSMYVEFEEAFSRMKKAAGVSDVDEVVTRFSTQGKTSDILGDQMKRAENDVRVLGDSKERHQQEWEVVRYLGQDEDVQIREKFEDMDLDMEEVTERFDKATGKLKGLESNHNMIKKKLSLMASIITGTDCEMETSNKLLSTCQKGLDKLLSKLGGMDLEHLQFEMEEVNFKPQGLDYGEDYREMEEQRKKRKDTDQDDGPEEEEVPTRESLVRQSELLVNAKQGPKKGLRRK